MKVPRDVTFLAGGAPARLLYLSLDREVRMWTSKTLRALPKLVITLAAVVAIGFGASEVLAEDAASACMIYPPTELGECYSEQHCELMCKQQPGYIPGSSFSACQSGCCACFL